MAGTYRPTIIRYLNSQVRQVPKGTPGARRVREKSKTFWGRVPDANGKVRSVVLCDDADVLPFHPNLAARLRLWLSERERAQDDQRAILSLHRAADAKAERLFPGTWSKRAFKMLRNDLEAAGIPYVTDDGIADFYSLRHTFISNLAAGGIHPKLAQQLARHSTIALTMDRYTHLGLIDMNSALESLPTIAAPDSQAMRATGTTDDAADFSCTKSCTRPAEINRF